MKFYFSWKFHKSVARKVKTVYTFLKENMDQDKKLGRN